MLSGRLPAETKEGVVFIDKSPQVFENILKLINCDKYMQVSRDLVKDLPFFGLRLDEFNKNFIQDMYESIPEEFEQKIFQGWKKSPLDFQLEEQIEEVRSQFRTFDISMLSVDPSL